MKIGPRLRFHILIFLKVFCQEHCIIQVNIRHHFIIRICHIRLQGQHIHGLFPDEKILRVDLVQQKHVIIEIDKPLGKSQNPVKIPFDGMGIKGRQKFRRDESPVHRYIAAFGVTDEIFGISASQPGKVSAFYNYGAMCVAIPGWVLGTLAGAISGNLLPDFMMSALSVAIYGMFLAIIIPPAKQNKAVLAVVVAAMVMSTLFKVIPLLSKVSSGFVIIITTLIVAGAAAYFCPIEGEKEEEKAHES